MFQSHKHSAAFAYIYQVEGIVSETVVYVCICSVHCIAAVPLPTCIFLGELSYCFSNVCAIIKPWFKTMNWVRASQPPPLPHRP